MSTSLESKRDYASLLVNHSAADAVKEDILLALFNQWLETDDIQEWKKIKARREALVDVIRMVAAIDAMAKELNPVDS